MIDYKSRIQELYREPCPYYEDCKRNVRYKSDSAILCKFRFDRARVGTDYGIDPRIPRIVMVGIEGFSDEQTVTTVTAPSLTASNAHYNGVKYVLAYLLSDFIHKEKPAPHITNGSVDWIGDALTRYCLCNLYRCAFVPESDPDRFKGLHHSNDMQTNCFERLLQELAVLDPDAIVLQVTDIAVLPEKNLQTLLSRFECTHPPYGNSNRARLSTGRLNGHPLQIIQTLHGGNGGFRAHRYLTEQLNPVLDKAVTLLKEAYPKT